MQAAPPLLCHKNEGTAKELIGNVENHPGKVGRLFHEGLALVVLLPPSTTSTLTLR